MCELLPSISKPSDEEMKANISSFFGPATHTAAPDGSVSGHCLMMDGIAVEQRASYSRVTNEVVGLCREHSGALDLHVISLDAIKHVAAALNDEVPTCHLGKECTVAALAPYRAKNYHAVPILVSPSCKAEKAEEMAEWIRRFLKWWKESPDGEARHGPIWCVATDGDGTFRRAKFALLMLATLSPESPLYLDLVRLEGLNLWTGEDEVTASADFKHVFKRFATLLRSSEGILVQDTIINQDSLARHLVKLPGLNAYKVANLIDPSDHQNVPKAVELLQAVSNLRGRDTSSFNPSELKAHHAMSLFADVIWAFLEPFINLDLSLSEQLRLLARYAHLACIMYRHHRTSFMTSQLYIDTQMIVKNIVFSVKKQQVLDSSKPFYIIHDGTDRLEMAFCDVRTQDHARNFDTLTLSRKLSISANINAIMLKHPELNRGHRRIKLSNREGPDHTNPASTRGDLVVSNVSLQLVWKQGREDAEQILAAHKVPGVSFAALWKVSDLDLMRPLGNGHYIGVQPFDVADRSVASENSTHPCPQPSPTPTAASGTNTGQDALDSPAAEIDLEDLIATEVTDKHTSASDWVEVVHDDGTREFYHKSSLVRIGLAKKDGGRIAIDRQLRSQGVKRDRFRQVTEVTSEVTDKVMFYTGDIGAGLVRCGNTVTLAVVEVTSLSVNGKKVSQIPVDSCGDVKAGVVVSGELLEICLTAGHATALGVPSDGGEALPDESPEWLWAGSFLQVKGASAKSSESSANHTGPVHLAARQTSQYCVRFPGWLFFPISPDMVRINPDSNTPLGAHEPPITWRFRSSKLQQLVADLWANSEAFSESPGDILEEMVTVDEEAQYPYRRADGQPAFVIENLPDDLRVQKLDKDAQIACLLCTKTIKLRDMRSHVGTHILRSQVGISEPLLTRKPGPSHPCGFCGLSGCSIALRSAGKKMEIRSNCKYHYDFSYNAALRSTANGPSTNVPVHCPICPIDPGTQLPPSYWRYNLEDHIHHDHAEEALAIAAGTDTPLAAKAARVKHVSKAEAGRLGIRAEVLTAYRHTNGIPGSDDVDQMDTEDAEKRGYAGASGSRGQAAGGVHNQRKRAGTSTVGNAQLPLSKRAAA
ncbi:uncharacterized protein TRAVEDRAFT_45796 [Trametes versicolor FP-101664 SS1]|uniref:uncharacterized protein n=1 Tax=Trametes versicolor (strain FP-101664) TaxID=717944 RepID=UPI0004622351|nr:uncharacterized protein TRAVEDRAFT_45796 [Trametes versicolor FP-101664 SS1]EIW60546.1 hypothetical protein TRAVEDRAFT_45796 [Trametes versicolor FP-101664 SS1]